MGTSPSKMLRSSTVAIRAVGQRACSNVVATVAPFPMPKSNIDKAQHADGQIKTYHEVHTRFPRLEHPALFSDQMPRHGSQRFLSSWWTETWHTATEVAAHEAIQ